MTLALEAFTRFNINDLDTRNNNVKRPDAQETTVRKTFIRFLIHKWGIVG